MTSIEVLKLIKSWMAMPLFQINQTPVTLSSLFLFFAVLLTFSILSRFLLRPVLVRTLNRLRLDEGTQYTFLRITQYVVLLVGMLVAFQFLGINLSGLFVVFGFLSVGIGFGLQNITSNFISGLILLFEQPIRVGDRVTVGDIEGDVSEINIRSTTVRSLNNISVIVPNSDFVSSQVVNWSHRDPKVRLELNVGVSYNSDLDNVIESLYEVVHENKEVLETPKPEVLHTGFGDSSWDMRVRVWILNPKRHQIVRSDLNCAIVRKFREKGVEIPFPQRDLHVRTPFPMPPDAIGTRADGFKSEPDRPENEV